MRPGLRTSGRPPAPGGLPWSASASESPRYISAEVQAVIVRLVVVGPTHSRGDTGFLVEEDGVLFSGDVVMNRSFLAARQESSMSAWLEAFDVFEAMDPEVVVPAHGPVGDGSLVPANREVMEAVRDRAVELKGEGRSVEEVAEVVQAELRARHPDWPRANGLTWAARAAYDEEP